GAVGVEQSRAHIAILRRKQPLHSVGADTVVPITQPPAEVGQVGTGVCSIYDKEIIPACARLDERNDRGAHSGSTGPNETAFRKMLDCCKDLSRRSWSCLRPRNSNCRRTCCLVGADCTFSMIPCTGSMRRLTSFSASSAVGAVTSYKRLDNFSPNCCSVFPRSRRQMRISPVANIAVRYRPPPTAIPIDATTKMVAALVRPVISSPLARRMEPAPMKPIPGMI